MIVTPGAVGAFFDGVIFLVEDAPELWRAIACSSSCAEACERLLSLDLPRLPAWALGASVDSARHAVSATPTPRPRTIIKVHFPYARVISMLLARRLQQVPDPHFSRP
jgi:hypothetical protein